MPEPTGRSSGSGSDGATTTRRSRVFRRSSEVLADRIVRPAFFRLEYTVDRRFDARAGIETVDRAHLDELTIDSQNVEFGEDELIYVALPVLALRAMRRVLPRDLEDFTFVDLGSGKGRVLVYASGLPFKRIVGVEFASELHRAAASNIARGRHPKQRCSDIEILHQDAVDLEIPDGPCVFFLFNPFEPAVLDRVVENIRRSLERRPRPAYIIYHNPVHRSCVDRHDTFEPVWSRTNSKRSECYDVVAYRARHAG